MQKSQIITIQSSHEGYPMVLIEAMLSKNVPIVFNSFESANDIINDGVNGVLVKPFNERRFAREMIKLAKASALLEQMQKNAVDSSTRFSVKRVVDDWENQFKSL